jgi:hypothetical protein
LAVVRRRSDVKGKGPWREPQPYMLEERALYRGLGLLTPTH